MKLLHKRLLKQFHNKNIKTPRKWDEYEYEATPRMSYFKKKKNESSTFNNDIFKL